MLFRYFTNNSLVPLTIRKKLGKLLRVPANKRFRANLFEGIYDGTTGNLIDDKIFVYGMHEPATLRLLRAIIRFQEGNRIDTAYLDVGTNSGQHLISVGWLANAAYGFEPWEKAREMAIHNLAINNMDNASVFDFGLSDLNTALEFVPPQGSNFGIGSFGRESGSFRELMLPVRTGDSFVSEKRIRPTLIKIDVEGHEQKVLKGLRQTIERYQPSIVFECGQELQKSLAEKQPLAVSLFGEGYSFYGIKRSREFPVLSPLQPNKKYENILAWPTKCGEVSILDKCARTDIFGNGITIL